MAEPRRKFISPYAAALESEHRYIQAASHEKRRVAPKKGDSWTIRILPTQFGDTNLWFARIAKHWLEKKPITCPRHTHPLYGGNLQAYCPVCDLVEEYGGADEATRKKAFESRSSAQWFTYALVFEKSMGGQDVITPPDELLIPYEFAMYKGTWEELIGFFRTGGRADNPLSVLDLVYGNDFVLSRGSNNQLRLDKLDSAPIFEDLADPAEEDPRIVKILKQCVQPRVTIPTDEQLDQFADKLREACRSSGRGDGGRSRRGGGDDYNDDNGPEEAVGRQTAPARSRRAAPAAEEQPAEDPVDEPQARPAPTRSAPATAPARRASTPPAPRGRPAPAAEEPADEPPAEEQGGEQVDGQGTDEGAEPPFDEQGGDQGGEPPAEDPPAEEPPARPSRTAPAAPQARRNPVPPPRTASGKPPTGQVEDEGDNLPPDDRDPVSPSQAPVAGTSSRRPASPASQPPPVARAGGTTVRSQVATRVAAAAAATGRSVPPRR